jgi:hypothetical protein
VVALTYLLCSCALALHQRNDANEESKSSEESNRALMAVVGLSADCERALPSLEAYYAMIAKISAVPFDVSRTARLEGHQRVK